MSDASILEVFLPEASELVRRAHTAAMTLEWAPPEDRAAPVEAILRDLHTLKGAAGSLNLPVGDHLAHQAHTLEDLLDQEDAQTIVGEVIERLAAASAVLERMAQGELLDATADSFAAEPPVSFEHPDVEGLFLFEDPSPAPQTTGNAVPMTAPVAKPAPVRTPNRARRDLLRVRPERIDAAHELASEMMVSRLQVEEQTRQIVELRDQLIRTHQAYRTLHGRLREKRRALGPLWTELDSSLGRLHGELTTCRKRANHLARRSTSLRDRSGSLVSSLESSIRSLRMMPIQPFLEELLPVVREAGRASGRSARLVLDGGGSEADRHVLVSLREPLLHLVRNSVAHGIGTPERRTASGRDPVGTITVCARCQGPRLSITIEDDGFGVDVQRVLQQGVERGLVAADTEPDDAVLLAILCQPGLSTADGVDELAGRGVGMNVVLSTVERLGGRLRLEARPSQGARFTLDVPIAAATTKGLVVECGDVAFGLPLAHVERVIRLRADDLIGRSHPFVHIEGEPVAVAPLGALMDQRVTELGDQRQPAVVLQAHGARLALLVDDVPGESELIVKPMPAAFAQHPLVTGGAVQADSSVLLVLDLPGLMQRVQREGVPA
jgi:chemotaxis protein histidine kinase CheA